MRSMQEYKAYLLGRDGRIASRVDLVCETEDAAKERAQLLAQDSPVELWQGQRLIAEYRRRH
jgi:hypothetical protein